MYLIALSILSYDVWFYLSHIILHNHILYKHHAEHHANAEPIFLDAYVGSTVENVFQGVGTFIPCAFYTYSITEIAIVLTLLNIRGFLRHDERGVFLIGNHHLLHHKHQNYNFGEYWIDSLCGTRYPNEKEYKYGLIYV